MSEFSHKEAVEFMKARLKEFNESIQDAIDDPEKDDEQTGRHILWYIKEFYEYLASPVFGGIDYRRPEFKSDFSKEHGIYHPHKDDTGGVRH